MDGLEDKVVEECAGCSLQMAGDPAYVIEVEGYSLHMCNESYKTAMRSDLSRITRPWFSSSLVETFFIGIQKQAPTILLVS